MTLALRLALSAGAALCVLVHYSAARFGPGFETIAVAHNLIANGSFSNPYASLPTGPTAHLPPLYPFFLSVILRAAGSNYRFVIAASLCAVLVHALHAWLLPSVSKLFFGDLRPGLWAAGMAAVLPLYFLVPQFETIYFATALLLFCLGSYRLVRAGAWGGAGTGILAGLIALLNPASITITAPWTGYLAWRFLKARRGRFLLCAAVGLVAALAPWTWRNYRQFHSLFFVRDNLGLELYVANNDRAQASLAQNTASGLYGTRHPNESLAEAREVVRMGEIAYNRDRMSQALAWMRDHPGRFAALTLARARMFWFPDAEGYPVYAAGVALVTIASAAGLFVMFRQREPVLIFFAAALLLYPLMYYLVENDPRFRAPILWISLLAAARLTKKTGATS